MTKDVIEGPLGRSMVIDHVNGCVTAVDENGKEMTIHAENGVIPEKEINDLFLFLGMGPLDEGEYAYGLTGGQYH